MNWNAKWIRPAKDTGDAAPIYLKDFSLTGTVKKATMAVTALGVYEAMLNQKRVGTFILAPGWTSYYKRLQYQKYDVTDLLAVKNQLTITVGKGWYRSPMPGFSASAYQEALMKQPAGLLVQLTIEYMDGTKETICSDESWKYAESRVRFSEIYDGEIYDASYESVFDHNAVSFDGPSNTLISQQGEEIHEQEHLAAACIFTTPKGETVIDFGQEVTGYVESHLEGKAGEVLDLSFAEVMDKEGNFYTENYRSAKARYHYICRDGKQTYKPKLTFWGFRYIRVNAFPGGIDKVTLDAFTAIAVHSDMKRTGYLSCSNDSLNKLFSNIIWGQKGNFVDVPTDCPQRDERLGWAGGKHYGDWLGLDAPSGSYKGASDETFIASAFYAYSTSLVIKAGNVLGEDVSEFEDLYAHIVKTFRSQYPVYHTQTECVLAAHFKLAENCQAAADQLAEMITACGNHLETGFVGTPYLLHVLSEYGHLKLAYTLLLREKYPSWLYPVTKGATTIWEHWDGIMEDGNFWSSDMNSYNHYAYGSVADWVYMVAAGINTVENAPGYEKILIAPHPDTRLDWLKAVLETRHGKVTSEWKKEENFWRYEITTPVDTAIVIDGKNYQVKAGSYCFYSEQK